MSTRNEWTKTMFPVEAEQAIIGALLIWPSQMSEVAAIVLASDFTKPDLAVAYETMLETWANGETYDQVTISKALGAPSIETLASLAYGDHFRALGGAEYAATIANAAQMRSVALGLGDIQTAVNEGTLTNAQDFVARINEVVADQERAQSADEASALPMADFLAQVEAEPEKHEWLVPNFIRRRWRIVIAGEEGIGKMVLLRQIGHCVAAGVHPFKDQQRITPRRVLFVDVENPQDTISEQTALISNTLDLVGMAEDRLHIYSNEAGINLAQPGDRRRFERIVANIRPDMVIAGPLYKLSRRQAGQSDWDSDAMDLINFFDDIRTRYNCALLLEHHLVKTGTNTHFRNPDQGGSAMFRRWPEMSFSMIEDTNSNEPGDVVKMHRYRRARNGETWPDRVRRRSPGPSVTGHAWQAEWDYSR
jgi:hypothetical protein